LSSGARNSSLSAVPANAVLPDSSSGSDQFQTTRWSVVLQSAGAQSGNDEGREALARLCRIYWRPVYAFICRHGHSTTDAQDLAQDFFVKVITGSLLQRADPQRGRFRTLLLTSVQNFLLDARARHAAKKRGGDVDFISWEDWMADAAPQFACDGGTADRWGPEQLFDVRWAATVVEQAQWRLREECEQGGRSRLFEAVRPCLAADREDVSYPELSKQLGVTEIVVKRVVHRLRVRYRELLRDEVARTVERPEDVDDELRYLCSALAAGDRAEEGPGESGGRATRVSTRPNGDGKR
jgi:RNA polymerase sigma factor (sigma-70 family)